LIKERWEIIVTGTVQGVGFRPFIYRLAERFALSGWVLNGPQGVRIQVQGPTDSLHSFTEAIQSAAPDHARIASLSYQTVPLIDESNPFKIIESDIVGESSAAVPADLAACPECLAEVMTPRTDAIGMPSPTALIAGRGLRSSIIYLMIGLRLR
jgi:hydrogenase maturation protein HypF